MKNYFISTSTEQTLNVGKFLGTRLLIHPDWQKIILFQGNLGAGKTTFIKGLAKSLSTTMKIKSPTYTYLQEHQFLRNQETWTLAHFDLYRKNKNQLNYEILEILEEKITDPKTITLIEWSENIPKDFLLPKKKIEIKLNNLKEMTSFKKMSSLVLHKNNLDISDSYNHRQITIKFFTPEILTLKEIKELKKEFVTPIHVQKHEKSVTKIANLFAKKIFQNGIPLDQKLTNTAANIHDFVRLINFKELDYNFFQEKITPQKKKKWEELRKKYKKEYHHAILGAEILKEKGFSACGDIVSAHRMGRIIEKEEMTLEEKIVYLSDKKVVHDQIVSLQERFIDSEKRHLNYDYQKRKKVQQKCKVLLKELLHLAGLKNEKEFDKKL